MRDFEEFRRGGTGEENLRNLQKIKVVQNQEHGQNDIDNHAGQNYNVERF